MKISELSNEDLFRVNEYMKCKQDVTYFIENYVKIPTPGGSQVMKLYEPQRDVVKVMTDDHYLVTLKSRQVGMSTLAQCYICHCVTFFENVVVGILSRSGDEASDFNRKITNMIDELPSWLRPEYVKRTEQTFILKNGCQSFSSGVNPANPSSVFRGKSLSVLVVDEVAFIQNISEAFASCGPSLVKAQQSARNFGNPYATFLISTPNKTSGTGKFYYDMWKKANSGLGIYKPVVLKWNMIKEFADDPNWYKTQCEILNNVEWKIAQELNCEFIQGGDSFFNAKTIKALQANEKPPLREINVDGAVLRLWENIDEEKFYLIGIDTASAYGTDSSTIEIVDFVTCKQVAEMRVKCRVDEFCPVVAKVSRMFPQNLIIFEANSFGNQLGEYLTKNPSFSFNIYQSKQKSPVLNQTGVNKNKVKYRYGIYTNPINRPLMMDALYTMIDGDPELILSRDAILELVGLVAGKNGKIAAEEGEHDDLSMALAFCYYVRQYDPPQGLSSFLNKKEVIEEVSQIASWNSEGIGGGGYDTSALVQNPFANKKEMELHDDQEVLNKQVQNFINNNFNDLMQNYFNQIKGTSNINVLQLMGQNTNTFFQ